MKTRLLQQQRCSHTSREELRTSHPRSREHRTHSSIFSVEKQPPPAPPAITMKTVAPLLASSMLLAASFANADLAQTNATSLPSTNTTTKARASIQGGEWLCTPEIWAWYYNSWSEGPYDCTTNHDTRAWGMLPAYRSGGTQGVHWKYTNDENDGQCLTGWKYYTSDGNGLIATVDRTTFVGDSKRWCALKVYRSGGVQGKQWDYCRCEYFP